MTARKRKKKKLLRTLLILLLLTALGWLGYRWFAVRQASFVTYPEFGIPIPTDYEIHGIDVSRYQGIIGWEQVKEMRVGDIRIGFAFIKATEGIGNMDPRFPRNWRQSRRNDVVRGAYHFFIGSKDGRLQAENFIKRVDLEPGDLPPVLDVEQRNGVPKAQLQREVQEWLDVVEEHYKVKPIIYTNVDFYQQNLGSNFDEYPLWVAHYYEMRQPRIRRDWFFWQHSDRGRVNGIRQPVDFNVFKGDSLDFKALLLPR